MAVVDQGLSADQIRFVETHLGIDLPTDMLMSALTDGLDLSDANPADIWLEARAQVDADMAALKSELARHDDPDLARIAEQGLNGVTDGNHVALMAALVTLGTARAEDRPKAAAAVTRRVEEFRAFLASDPLIRLCEDNPTSCRVAIVAPLGRALDRIERAVAA